MQFVEDLLSAYVASLSPLPGEPAKAVAQSISAPTPSSRRNSAFWPLRRQPTPPDCIIDQISLAIMEDPVFVVEIGATFDRLQIERYFFREVSKPAFESKRNSCDTSLKCRELSKLSPNLLSLYMLGDAQFFPIERTPSTTSFSAWDVCVALTQPCVHDTNSCLHGARTSRTRDSMPRTPAIETHSICTFPSIWFPTIEFENSWRSTGRETISDDPESSPHTR